MPRVADSTKRSHLHPGQRLDGCVRRQNRSAAWREFNFDGAFRLTRDPGANRIDLFARHLVNACDDDEIGSREGRRGFAQQAPGQQIIETPGIAGVDQHDVEVACEPAMLKAVVKNQELAAEFLSRHGRRGNAVGALQMRHIGTKCLEDPRLIIHPVGPGPVATADEADARTAFAKPARDEGSQRCLAGSAGRQVSETDDRDRHTRDSLPAQVVDRISNADTTFINAPATSPGSKAGLGPPACLR